MWFIFIIHCSLDVLLLVHGCHVVIHLFILNICCDWYKGDRFDATSQRTTINSITTSRLARSSTSTDSTMLRLFDFFQLTQWHGGEPPLPWFLKLMILVSNCHLTSWLLCKAAATQVGIQAIRELQFQVQSQASHGGMLVCTQVTHLRSSLRDHIRLELHPYDL